MTLWLNNANQTLQSTTLAHVLGANGESDTVSIQFDNIDIEWLPTDATTAAEVQQVKLSGNYRGERVILYKQLQ